MTPFLSSDAENGGWLGLKDLRERWPGEGEIA